MILGYSELLKEVYGVSATTLKDHLSRLLSTKPDEKKLAVLRLLAQKKRETASNLLRSLGMNNTGGSYKSLKNFFSTLIFLEILSSEEVGRRTYYSFKNKEIAHWLEE